MKYDIAIIGGGPAGMMAAGRAGELGARVILIEKNKNLGVKLLMTGNGRCNLTNSSGDEREFIQKFGKNGKFLFSSLHQFGPGKIIEFFENRGVKTKVEEKGRVFPVSDRAEDVLNALKSYMEKSGVEVRLGANVDSLVKNGKSIIKIILTNGDEIPAKNFVISTGGKSCPETGSTGDAYQWLKELGHSIVQLRPALVPIVIKNEIVKELEGVSLSDARISAYKDNRKIQEERGEAIFTVVGMSGPVILLLSRKIGNEFPGKVEIKIDLIPDLEFKELEGKMLQDFRKEGNKFIKNYLDSMLPLRLVSAILRLAKIDPGKKGNLITRDERKALVHLMKEFGLEVEGLEGFERAVVTAGGIKLSEVDPKTMKSKIVDNLYFAGEILDLDGPTGGYNLQVCWSTGFVAGEGAASQ